MTTNYTLTASTRNIGTAYNAQFVVTGGASAFGAAYTFVPNGANSLFLARDSAAIVRVYRFNPASVSGSVSHVASYTGGSNVTSVFFYLNGTNSYTFICDTNIIRFWRGINPATISGDFATGTANATFTASGTGEIKFVYNGSTSYLVANGTDGIRFWRFDPDTISSTGTAPTATFTATNIPNIKNSLVFREDGANSILIAGSTTNNTAARLWRFDSATVSGTVGSITASFATISSASIRSIGYEEFSGTSYLIAATFNDRRIQIFAFNKNTITTTGTATTATLSVFGTYATQNISTFQNSGILYILQSESTENSILVNRVNPATASGTITNSLVTQLTGTGASADVLGLNNTTEAYIFSRNSIGGYLFYKDDLNTRDAAIAFEDRITLNSAQPISKASGGAITLNSSLAYFLVSLYLRSGAGIQASGYGTSVFGYAFTPTSDTTGTLTESFTFSGTSAITGDYRITISSGTVTLGSRTTYNDKFTLQSGTTLLINQNTELTADFILESGVTVNRSGGGSYTLTIPYADPGLIVGTGVTIAAPQSEIRLYGIPNVTNAILYVKNLTTNVVTYPTLISGEAAITVDPAANYQIRADAPGYLASDFITIPGNTPEYQFNLVDYRALYESGINRSSQISFNYSTFVVTINDDLASYTFADVFRTIEDYLSTSTGILFPNPPFPVVLPDRNILWFPYDDVLNTVNPVIIKPDPTNTTDPTLTNFEVYLEGATDPVFDLFDFSDAGGRIIRVRAQVAVATVTGSGALTPTQDENLTAIKNAVVRPMVDVN